jgi:23S rRNA pseudouridine2605 synthase
MMRLNKYLAEAGVDSRRKVEDLILSGRVTINGKVTTDLATTVDPSSDEIRLDGDRVVIGNRLYLVLNKPEGVVTTSKDDQGRPTVLDLLPTLPGRVVAVGRLDVDTTGLLVMTNDGDLAFKLTHPSYELGKTYRVTVKGKITTEQKQKIEAGVWLSEGKTSPTKVRIVEVGREYSVAELTIHEGFNRQVRRMFAKVDLKVKHVARISVGPLELGDLPIGKVRMLLPDEVAMLEAAVKTRKPPTKLVRVRRNVEEGKRTGRPPMQPPSSGRSRKGGFPGRRGQ